MPTDDPDKLQAALDQLEAEREARVQAKLEAGTAVRGGVTVVGGVESIDSVPTHDSEGREIVYGKDDPVYIVTGVPRAGSDDKFIERIEREIARGKYGTPNKPLPYQPRVETSTIPAPSKPAPQVERPPQPKRIVVQTRECMDADDPGEVVEGWFDVRGSILYVWSEGAAPIGQVAISPGDDVEHAARKLLREK